MDNLNILTNPNLNWTVFIILSVIMIANVVVGSLHAKVTNEFNAKYFLEHIVKKVIFSFVLLVTIVFAHEKQVHELGTLLMGAYAWVEGKSFKKHFLDYQEEKEK